MFEINKTTCGHTIFINIDEINCKICIHINKKRFFEDSKYIFIYKYIIFTYKCGENTVRKIEEKVATRN